MRCSIPVSATTLVGLACLSILFVFDPTHDYPSTTSTIEIAPRATEPVELSSGMTSFMKWASGLIGEPYLWIRSNASGLYLDDVDREMPAGLLVGVPYGNTTNATHVTNVSNRTIISTISMTIAPQPDVLGASKTWWYIIFAVIQTLVGGGLALTGSSKSPSAVASSTKPRSPRGDSTTCVWHCCPKKHVDCGCSDDPDCSGRPLDEPPSYAPVEETTSQHAVSMSALPTTSAQSTTASTPVATSPSAISPSTPSTTTPVVVRPKKARNGPRPDPMASVNALRAQQSARSKSAPLEVSVPIEEEEETPAQVVMEAVGTTTASSLLSTVRKFLTRQ